MAIREDKRRGHPTVLERPSVTVYMDGLILLFHDESRRLMQAAVHTQAPHHELLISVFDKSGKLIWPADDSDWDGSHHTVKSVEPLWLFVAPDDETPPPPAEFNARLHTDGELSFNRVLDFESELYDHRLEGFRRDRVAVINMPHGVFYSATHAVSELHSFAQGQDPKNAVFDKNIDSSTLGAADIASRSTREREAKIVLWQENQRRRLFSFPLGEDSSYEIHVFNVPPPGTSHADFIHYYELFMPRPSERKFLVKPTHVLTSDSPPCNVGQGSQTDSV